MLMVFILGILSLFWAVEFKLESRIPNLRIWVVDFDVQEPYSSVQPIVGPAITDTVKDIIDSPIPNLGYTIKSPQDFNNDPTQVRLSVYHEHAYAAIIVNRGATTRLRDAIEQGDGSYNPEDAGEVVTISARDQTTYSSYIIPYISQFETQALEKFGPRWAPHLANNTDSFSAVPQAINPGIAFKSTDLRPFAPAASTPTVTIGLIYLIIIAFFNFPFLVPIHAQYVNGDHPPLKIPQWLLWRLLSNFAAYFCLSLFYSLVSLAFQIPFSRPSAPETIAANANAYGRGSFVVYWMLNWVGMTALGLPCENMAMILGFPWSSLFLIFWVISNVATGFYALDLAPGFYRWGYAWPLHRSMFSTKPIAFYLVFFSLFLFVFSHFANLRNFVLVVEACRTILYDTHSRIGLDFGILFAWIAVSIVLFPLASLFMRWRMQKFGR